MRKIFDSKAFYPQEDIKYYLDPSMDQLMEWHQPLTKKELTELSEEWPIDTKIDDVFPHCRGYFKYPRIEDNIYLYRELTESKDFKGLFDPLDFFNLLYEQLKYCLDRVNIDTQLVIDHLEGLNLVKRKLHFFLYSLHYLIKGLNGSVTADRHWPNGVYTVNNEKLAAIHIEIISAYQSLEGELDIETENTDLPNVKMDWSTPINISAKTNSLKLRQVALIHVYKNNPITRNNAQIIAKEFGFISRTSGEGLYHYYIFYTDNMERKGNPGTEIKLKNKIDLLEGIIDYLESNAKEWALAELKILKGYIN
jgi:hypothetical protein